MESLLCLCSLLWHAAAHTSATCTCWSPEGTKALCSFRHIAEELHCAKGGLKGWTASLQGCSGLYGLRRAACEATSC